MAVEKKFLSKRKYKVIKNDRGGDLTKMWYVRWKLPDGRHRKKYGKLAHIHDLAERQKALEELRRHWDFELNGTNSLNAFEKIYDYLRATAQKKRWRKKTTSSYISKIKRIADVLGNREITKENLKDALEQCRAMYHPVTFNRKLSDFKTFLQAVGEGHLFPEAVERIPNARSEPARYLMDGELELLKQRILGTDPELWLAVQFIFNCAIRPGELRLLQKKHLYLDEQQVHIPGHISKTAGKARWAPIPDTFIQDLQHMRAWPPTRYLFCSPFKENEPVGANYFARKIRKHMDALGFDNEYRPCYSFRNTSAKKGIESGMTEKEMMDAWGHHSLDQFIYYMRKMGAIGRTAYKKKFKGI